MHIPVKSADTRVRGDIMNCSFCHRSVHSQNALRVYSLVLCPDCLNALLSVSPSDREYGWFVSAMRRSVSENLLRRA